jgi:hypothetical protein
LFTTPRPGSERRQPGHPRKQDKGYGSDEPTKANSRESEQEPDRSGGLEYAEGRGILDCGRSSFTELTRTNLALVKSAAAGYGIGHERGHGDDHVCGEHSYVPSG